MNMLSKKTKYENNVKQNSGKPKGNYSLNYGSFGLKAMGLKELLQGKSKLQEKL